MKTAEQKQTKAMRPKVPKPLEEINAVEVSRRKLERLNKLVKGVPLPVVPKS